MSLYEADKKKILRNYNINEVVVGGVYKITNTAIESIYIGSSTDIHSRFAIHELDLINNAHHNRPLQIDWNEFGKECFIFEIIWQADEHEDKNHILFMEQLYINKYDPEYNIKKEVCFVKDGSQEWNKAKRERNLKQIESFEGKEEKQHLAGIKGKVVSCIIKFFKRNKKFTLFTKEKGVYFIQRKFNKKSVVFYSKEFSLLVGETKEILVIEDYGQRVVERIREVTRD